MFLMLAATSAVQADDILSESAQVELYSQGVEMFNRAQEISEKDPAAARELYSKALLRFNRLVEEGGVRNGRLFYNIGNINFLLEDTGRAILNYRRAKLYIPNDPYLVKNLSYARLMRQDRLETKEQKKIQQTLFFFHYDIGNRARLVLFAVSYALFWIFAGVRIFTRRPYTGWVLAISLFFAILFGGSLLVEQYQYTSSQEGVILAPEVVARQGDADSYQPSFEDPLHSGTEFLLLEDRGGWWQIELPDGRNCWIPSRSAALVRISS